MAGAVLALARGDWSRCCRPRHQPGLWAEPRSRCGRLAPAGGRGLIGLGRREEAAAALAELDSAIPAFGLPSASMTAARLHGNLAVLRGDLAGAEESFAAAWQLARACPAFQLALLERDDGRRLRRAGDRPNAVTRLRQARDHLAALGARPYVTACERELAHCGPRYGPNGHRPGT